MKKFFVPLNVAEKRLDSIDHKITAWRAAGLNNNEIDEKIKSETLAAIKLAEKALKSAPKRQSHR